VLPKVHILEGPNWYLAPTLHEVGQNSGLSEVYPRIEFQRKVDQTIGVVDVKRKQGWLRRRELDLEFGYVVQVGAEDEQKFREMDAVDSAQGNELIDVGECLLSFDGTQRAVRDHERVVSAELGKAATVSLDFPERNLQALP